MQKWIAAIVTVCGLCGQIFSATAVAGEEISKKDRDRDAILSMAGTFEVKFQFEETTAFQSGYEIRKPYTSDALEVVIVDEETPDKIVLQHILQTGGGRIVKHWRQDWLYQNTTLLEFQGDNVWTRREITPEEAEGTWTQRVFQVDDSPRYESYGKWVHLGNLSEWRSRETMRPLPRREHTTRDDYNILLGFNRHALTPTGWVHEQDNTKLKRSAEGDVVIAREIGLNTYSLTRESRCAESRQWWRDNRAFWKDVQAEWDKVFAAHDRLVMLDAVEEAPLYEHLSALGNEASKAGEYSSEKFVPELSQWIDRFIVRENEGEKLGKAN